MELISFSELLCLLIKTLACLLDVCCVIFTVIYEYLFSSKKLRVLISLLFNFQCPCALGFDSFSWAVSCGARVILQHEYEKVKHFFKEILKNFQTCKKIPFWCGFWAKTFFNNFITWCWNLFLMLYIIYTINII